MEWGTIRKIEEESLRKENKDREINRIKKDNIIFFYSYLFKWQLIIYLISFFLIPAWFYDQKRRKNSKKQEKKQKLTSWFKESW